MGIEDTEDRKELKFFGFLLNEKHLVNQYSRLYYENKKDNVGYDDYSYFDE